jgi:hypothetical protein
MNTTCVSNRNIGEVLSFLSYQISQGDESKLTGKQPKILNSATNLLSEIALKHNRPFNKNGFKRIVKMCVPYHNQAGGVNSGSLTIYKKSNVAVVMMDFTAILFLICSIILTYYAYIDICEYLSSLGQIDNDEEGFTSLFRDKINDALAKNGGSEPMLSYPMFLFQIFSSSATSHLQKMNDKYKTMIVVILSNVANQAISDITASLSASCLPTTNSNDGWLRKLHTAISASANVATSAKCVTDTLSISMSKIQSDQSIALRHILLKVDIKTNTLYNNIAMAARLGWISVPYLAYRIQNGFRNNEPLTIEPSPAQLDDGLFLMDAPKLSNANHINFNEKPNSNKSNRAFRDIDGGRKRKSMKKRGRNTRKTRSKRRN